MVTTRYIIAVAGVLVALLAQVLLAPHIAILSVQPNFLLAFCLAMAVLYANESGPVAPFVSGLLFDLISGGPVGAMAFSLCAVSVASAWFFQRADNDTLFMALVVLVASVLLVEVVFGSFLLLFGFAAGFLEALAYRIVPSFAYDALIAVVIYLVASRALGGSAPVQPEISQLQ